MPDGCVNDCEILKEVKLINRRLDKIETTQEKVVKNQLVAKITVSVLMGFSLLIAWFIDHANILTDLFGGRKGD